MPKKQPFGIGMIARMPARNGPTRGISFRVSYRSIEMRTLPSVTAKHCSRVPVHGGARGTSEMKFSTPVVHWLAMDDTGAATDGVAATVTGITVAAAAMASAAVLTPNFVAI